MHKHGDRKTLAESFSASVDVHLKLTHIVFWLSALFLWSLVLDAPLRYGLSQLHLGALIYLPKLLLCVAVISLPILRLWASPAAWLVGGLAVVYLVWGMVNLANPLQSIFGFWVLVPLLSGLVVGTLTDISQWRRLFYSLFIVTALGLFLDPIIAYPWSGKNITLFSKEIEVSRQWTAFGIERYAGFSRASFNAATQLLIFGLMLVVFLDRRWLKVFVWLLVGVGVALTTSKGLFGGWLLLSVYFSGGAVLGWPRYWAQLWLMMLAIILLMMIVVPLSTLFLHYDPNLQGAVMKFLFASFGDRLNWMWPDSLQLLNLDGSYHWWSGRGLGGIGAAQQYFEPSHYLAADNLFVYLAVALGLPVAVGLLLALWLKSTLVVAHMQNYYLPLILFIVSYGMVANVLEEPLLGFVLGLALSQSGRNYASHNKSS